MNGSEVSLAAAFAAGVLSFLSPCVLPLVPGYLALLAGDTAGQQGRQRFIVNTACFFAGFTLVFLLMGATASLLGQLFIEHQDIVRQAGAVIIALMGLKLTGVLRLGALERDWRRLPGGVGGPFGAFVLGLALTAGWTPCIGPILAAILTYAGIEAAPGRGVLLLTAYAAGFAVPFVLFTFIYRRWLARIRAFYRWLPVIQKAAGVLLIITAFLLYFDLVQKGLGLIYSSWPW
jgi:cytochrome c-type biogenesis protein